MHPAESSLFRARWGATGLCPGPALVSLARPSMQVGADQEANHMSIGHSQASSCMNSKPPDMGDQPTGAGQSTVTSPFVSMCLRLFTQGFAAVGAMLVGMAAVRRLAP